jgi:short-subunit dehydrogenase
MLAQGRGRIVNVSSGVGLTAIPMLSTYVVSKTALYRLSESFAAETITAQDAADCTGQSTLRHAPDIALELARP